MIRRESEREMGFFGGRALISVLVFGVSDTDSVWYLRYASYECGKQIDEETCLLD